MFCISCILLSPSILHIDLYISTSSFLFFSIEDKLSETRINLQILKELVNEGIDVFNMSSPFYNDICFQYNSQKDIALKDRILEYFPNITLCEEGCDLIGINMTSITTICECYYSETKREDN